MPTITIDTPARPPSQRRAIAVRLTRWFATRDVRPAHVVVRFVDTAEGSVFSGGTPVDALPQGASPYRHASVVCCVGTDRDETFRAELAGEISEALGTTEETPFLYIEFRPTSSSHVHTVHRGRMTRADDPGPASTHREEKDR